MVYHTCRASELCAESKSITRESTFVDRLFFSENSSQVTILANNGTWPTIFFLLEIISQQRYLPCYVSEVSTWWVILTSILVTSSEPHWKGCIWDTKPALTMSHSELLSTLWKSAGRTLCFPFWELHDSAKVSIPVRTHGPSTLLQYSDDPPGRQSQSLSGFILSDPATMNKSAKVSESTCSSA